MPEDGFTIRVGTLADLESMYQLDRVCFEPPFRFSRAAMRHFAGEEGAFTLIAEAADHALAGFTIVHVDYVAPRHQAYVVTLDVAPEHRRRGLARRLLQSAENKAASQHASLMTLHVWTENTPAVTFYERSGYTRTVLHPNMYAPGTDAYGYLKVLPDSKP